MNEEFLLTYNVGLKDHAKAIIASVALPHDESDDINASLDELELLLKTLGITVAGRVIQRRQKMVSGSLIGTGKVEEIKNLADQSGAQLVVFDQKLAPPQVRNLSEILKCEVLDRAGVILDIFGKHAQSKAAKIQVEIARLEYLMPRLAGAWSHLGRQTAGGVARGMGEKQIEVDRRRARERLARLRKKLVEVESERKTQSRSRQNELRVALIGYTNSGKTTIMSAITTGTEAPQDALFATLDTSIRLIDPNTHPRILLSDTVGFIDKLPHGLIASFKSTLAEALEADLLLNVVDISHPNYENHIKTTASVLEEIGATEIPMLMVFNKLDQCEMKFLPKILHAAYPHSISISAHNPADIKKMRTWLFDHFSSHFQRCQVKIPSAAEALISYIYRHTHVVHVEYEDDIAIFDIMAPEHIVSQVLNHKDIPKAL